MGEMVRKILFPFVPRRWHEPGISCLGSNSSTPHKLCDMGKTQNSLSLSFLMSVVGRVWQASKEIREVLSLVPGLWLMLNQC